MSDLPYNNNPKDECFYCSHIYTFHFASSSSSSSSSSSASDDNIQEGNSIESKKDSNDVNPKGCSFVNNFNKSSCNCPGFRSSSLSSITN